MNNLTFWEHLADLRGVFFRSFLGAAFGIALSLYFSDTFFSLLKSYLPKELPPLVLFSPGEGLATLFKFSIYSGCIFAAPYFIYEILNFVAPALHERLQKLLYPFLFICIAFVISGVTLCLNFTLPIANQYLFSFNRELGTNLWGFSAYFNYVLLLIFSHAATFLLGAFLLLLVHLNILKPKHLVSKRRHAIVLSLIVAALITPPDVLTQVILAVPLYGFFELSILYGKVRDWPKLN